MIPGNCSGLAILAPGPSRRSTGMGESDWILYASELLQRHSVRIRILYHLNHDFVSPSHDQDFLDPLSKIESRHRDSLSTPAVQF
eukprot:COSAG02_NODE_150_length_33596_cov_61.953966_11_plen_85_part_00